jgi:hypothetical protein
MRILAWTMVCALSVVPCSRIRAQQTSIDDTESQHVNVYQITEYNSPENLASSPLPNGEHQNIQSSSCPNGDEKCDCDSSRFDWGGPRQALPGCYVQFEALFLHLSTTGFASSGKPLVINTGTGQSLLSSNQINDTSFQLGPRITLGRTWCDGDGWEVSYFGIDGWSSIAKVNGNGDLAIPGDLGVASLSFFNTDAMSVSLLTQLHSFEINYDRQFDIFTMLGGFRYINLTEQFDIRPSDPSSQYRISTRNNLFGGQIGARTGQQMERLSWSLTAKVGIFGNDAKQQQYVEDFPAFNLRDANSNLDCTAFVGEINFLANYQVNKTWSLRVGYNLIWVNQIALAPAQVDFTNTTQSGTVVATNDGLFLHGANVGLEAHW